MVAPPPPREASQRPAAKPEAPPETPSRAPWIIVGVLAVVAIAGAILVIQLSKKNRGGGQIAIPMGSGQVEEAPVEPTATASASATAAPTVRHPVKPKNFLDDPYADVPTPTPGRPRPAPTPSAAPTAAPAKNRLFGTEN